MKPAEDGGAVLIRQQGGGEGQFPYLFMNEWVTDAKDTHTHHKVVQSGKFGSPLHTSTVETPTGRPAGVLQFLLVFVGEITSTTTAFLFPHTFPLATDRNKLRLDDLSRSTVL